MNVRDFTIAEAARIAAIYPQSDARPDDPQPGDRWCYPLPAADVEPQFWPQDAGAPRTVLAVINGVMFTRSERDSKVRHVHLAAWRDGEPIVLAQ